MDLFSLKSLLFFFLVSLCVYIYFYMFSSPVTPNNKGFTNYPIIGALPGFIQNAHRFLDWTAQVLADCPTHSACICRPGSAPTVLTANPQNVEYMLRSNFENYPKGLQTTYILHDLFGRGILTSDGELWKVQRKTASYEFNTRSLRNFAVEIVALEIQTRLLTVLYEACRTQSVLDLQIILDRFSFDTVCKFALNVDTGCLGGDGTKGDKYREAFDDAANFIVERYAYPIPLFWKVKRFFNIGSERRLRESMLTIHQFADDIVRSRINTKEADRHQDLLSRFVGNEGNGSPEFVRDVVINFVTAGRDTTSAVLTWFFWILSSRPDVKRNILDELDSIRAKRQNQSENSTDYSFEELRDMNYLHAAITETIRLYPPATMDTKTCLEDDVLPDGTVVKKAWFLAYHTYAMGRMQSIWGNDCCEYKPERWLEKGVYRAESPFRFPAFHAGPRICLGKDLAYIQMKAIAAAVIERFDIEVQEESKRPQYLQSLTLRMKGGLQMIVKENGI